MPFFKDKHKERDKDKDKDRDKDKEIFLTDIVYGTKAWFLAALWMFDEIGQILKL